MKITTEELKFITKMFDLGLRYFYAKNYSIIFCFHAKKGEFFIEKEGAYLEFDTRIKKYNFLSDLRVKAGTNPVPFYHLFLKDIT